MFVTKQLPHVLLLFFAFGLWQCKKDNTSNKVSNSFFLQMDIGGDAMATDIELTGNGKSAILFQNRRNDSLYSGIIFLNEKGKVDDIKEFRYPDMTILFSHMVKGDNFLYITGSNNNNRQYLIKTDLEGNLIWERLLPNEINGRQFTVTRPADIIYTLDNYIVMLSNGVQTFLAPPNNILYKYDTDGNLYFGVAFDNDDIVNLRTARCIADLGVNGYWHLADRWLVGNDTNTNLTEFNNLGVPISNSTQMIGRANARWTLAQAIQPIDKDFVVSFNLKGTYNFHTLARFEYPYKIVASVEINKFIEAFGPNCLHVSENSNIYLGAQLRNEATGISNFALFSFTGQLTPKWERIAPVNAAGCCMALQSEGGRLYAAGYTIPEKSDGKRKIISVMKINMENGTFD